MQENEIKVAIDAIGITNYRFFNTIGSTNDEGVKWVDDGAPEYALIIANSQTAGRGRQNRKWITTPGSSIAMSVVLNPSEKETEKLSLFSLLGGLAVRDAINTLYGIQPAVKWPNDVLINGKKCVGILAEAVWEQRSLKGLVLGVGINLCKAAIPVDANLIFPATCIQDHTSRHVDPIEIICATIEAVKTNRQLLLQKSFKKEYERHLAFIGECVTLQTADGQRFSGRLEGIDPTGNLLLELESGKRKAFTIGDISLRQA